MSAALPLDALVTVEHERLAHLEGVIARGLDTFMEVGTALGEIRDARFYRFTHGTFEDYLRDRWRMSRFYAHRLIEAAEVAAMLPTGNVPNEAVARELVPVMRSDPDALPAVMAEAVERSDGAAPTAAVVRQVVIERSPDGLGRQGPIMLSESSEWYTPADIVARVVATMGAIDLDPCAEPARGIPAAAHLTAEDDGLSHGWRGRVFCNPPYSRVADFALRLAEEYRHGNVSEAILLAHARTETRWWQAMPSQVICLIKGRLHFVSGATGEDAGASTSPSAALYLGRDPGRFIEAFAPVGRVYQEVIA